jgi:hypothetical protein
MDREERRFRTRRIAERRLRDRLFWVGRCDIEWHLGSPFYYAKVAPLHCDCRKRRHGAPRRPSGMCDCGYRFRIYAWRLHARDVDRLAVRFRREDWEGDDIALAECGRRRRAC